MTDFLSLADKLVNLEDAIATLQLYLYVSFQEASTYVHGYSSASNQLFGQLLPSMVILAKACNQVLCQVRPYPFPFPFSYTSNQQEIINGTEYEIPIQQLLEQIQETLGVFPLLERLKSALGRETEEFKLDQLFIRDHVDRIWGMIQRAIGFFKGFDLTTSSGGESIFLTKKQLQEQSLRLESAQRDEKSQSDRTKFIEMDSISRELEYLTKEIHTSIFLTSVSTFSSSSTTTTTTPSDTAIEDTNMDGENLSISRIIDVGLDWLTPLNFSKVQRSIFQRRYGESGSWILESKEFLEWVKDEHGDGEEDGDGDGGRKDKVLWCTGAREYCFH